MIVDPKKADAYVRELLQKFEKDRESLDAHTRRLIVKYKEAQQLGDRTLRDLEQMRNQIKQAEARARSIELQVADAQGKAAAMLEILISMKFEDETEAEKNVDRTPQNQSQKTTAPLQEVSGGKNGKNKRPVRAAAVS